MGLAREKGGSVASSAGWYWNHTNLREGNLCPKSGRAPLISGYDP